MAGLSSAHSTKENHQGGQILAAELGKQRLLPVFAVDLGYAELRPPWPGKSKLGAAAGRNPPLGSPVPLLDVHPHPPPTHMTHSRLGWKSVKSIHRECCPLLIYNFNRIDGSNPGLGSSATCVAVMVTQSCKIRAGSILTHLTPYDPEVSSTARLPPHTEGKGTEQPAEAHTAGNRQRELSPEFSSQAPCPLPPQ